MKILISPEYGAGWTTYFDHEAKKFALTYAPIIEALERGEKLDFNHPVVKEFQKQLEEKFNIDPYLGGLLTLCVREVKGVFYIKEYDGWESVITQDNENWYNEDEF